MLNANSVTLRNVVTFKRAKLRITKAPLTFIYGENRDAEVDGKGHLTGNGSGKSLLCSAIPNVRYSAPPTARAKKAKKDLLYKKGSSIVFDLTNATGNHVITQTKSSLSITTDGKDVGVKTIPHAEKLVAEIFPLTDVEFYTTGFLSVNRKFSFQSATDSERLDYITSIFRFDYFDKLQKHFAKAARAIKDDEIRLQVLEQTVHSLRKKVKKLKASLGDVDIEVLKKQRKRFDESAQASSAKLFDLNRLMADVEALLATERKLEKLRAKYDSEYAPEKQLKILKRLRSELRDWIAYERELNAYTERHDELQSELKKAARNLVFEGKPKDDALEKLTAKEEALDKKISDLTSTVSEEEQNADDYAALEKRVKKLKAALGDSKPEKADTLKEEIARVKLTLNLERLLEHDHDGDDASCPTCLSKVDLSSVRRAVKSAKKALPSLETRLEQVDQHEEYQKARKLFKDMTYDPEVVEDLQTQLVKARKERNKIREQRESVKEYTRVTREIGKLKKPAKLEFSKPKVSMEILDEQVELCTEIISLVETRAEIVERADFTEYGTPKGLKATEKIEAKITTRIKTTETELRECEERLAKVSAQLDSVSTVEAELDLYRRELKEANTETDKLAPKLADKKIVEALLKFYSSKGQRAKAADAVCTLLEANMNMYRELLFLEPFKFEMSASETGVSIFVDRGNGHSGDVRFLSAAEANCFSCLFLLSLLPLIPDMRRLNFVILDEPMANAHPVLREVFRDKFLPVLCTVVPHVIVVTNNDNDYIEGARKLYIVKEGGVSKIVEHSKTN